MHSSVPPAIPGTLLSREDADPIRYRVSELLERDRKTFPGAQPVSFARDHLNELQRREYFMCEKTDGVRCLLFLDFRELDVGDFIPAIFLIDRKNNYYYLPDGLRFPHYKYPNDLQKFSFGTLLDGELVHDRVPGEAKSRLVYYVFDCLAVDNVNFTQKPLDKRLGYMEEQIIKPYNAYRTLIANTNPALLATEPFRIKQKQMHSSYRIGDMFTHVLPNLPHGNDGLVFTCKSTKYKFGTDEHILKWKPPHENTIDFKLRLGAFPLFDPDDGGDGPIPDYDAMPDRFQLLVLHDRNEYRPFADLAVDDAEWETLKSLGQRLDGRIIECYRDDQGRWRYKREDDGTPRWRDDKSCANHISTVRGVLDSIEDGVSEQELIAAESKIHDAVKLIRAQEAEVMKRKQREFLEMEQRNEGDREGKKRKLSDMNGGEAQQGATGPGPGAH
ncbi:mRNA-capping enzyme subunit alpha [Lepidopterella palustris CBS 459.81]|uniref:mRNA-capping enzyme subunit alpha n=1 Tax=Lepidopterella palustris CBS 459.81 TaxID=1314670 RepID=A0A8E2EBQ7_9PEZI|nr:mRNA-capping enzyme subunit alpha [Lepidopterella palustris CBS 459.81]